jgi:hypothetical protein
VLIGIDTDTLAMAMPKNTISDTRTCHILDLEILGPRDDFGRRRLVIRLTPTEGKPVILVNYIKSKAESVAREIGALDHYELDTGNIEAINGAL